MKEGRQVVSHRDAGKTEKTDVKSKLIKNVKGV